VKPRRRWKVPFDYDRSLLRVANSLSRSAAADKFFERTSFYNDSKQPY
jgi:hypothetical protein